MRPPSRPYAPETPEELGRHYNVPALAACYARGCTEAETIAILAEQLDGVRREFARYRETDNRPMVFRLAPQEAIGVAVAAERAACAAIADSFAPDPCDPSMMVSTVGLDIARAIRARK